MKTPYIYMIALICSVLLMDGCTKSAPTKESFTFYGYVTNCISGQPVANTKVLARGVTAAKPGIFGTPGIVYDLGNAVTDDKGFFRISLLKVNGVITYDVSLTDKLQQISFGNGITLDSVQKTMLPQYNMSLRENTYGYLKVTYTDSVLPDATDMVTIDVHSDGNACGSGFDCYAENTVPLSNPTDVSTFTGNIRNGIAYYKVMGDNNSRIFYQKGSKSFTDSTHHATLYCNANDTTYYHFTY